MADTKEDEVAVSVDGAPPAPSPAGGEDVSHLSADAPGRDVEDLVKPLLGGGGDGGNGDGDDDNNETTAPPPAGGGPSRGRNCLGGEGPCCDTFGEMMTPSILKTRQSRLELLTETFPFLLWGPRYNLRRAMGDAIAGLTVGAVIIPQSLAYAKLANMTPITGLYSSLMCLLVYPLLGSCRYLSVGPVAVVCVVIGQALADSSPEDKARHAFVLSITSGVLMALMALFRAGFVGNILSRPIQHGFINAVVLTVIIEQVDELFGFKTRHTTYPVERFGWQLGMMPNAQWKTALIGFASVLYCAVNVVLMKCYPKQVFLQLGILVLVAVSILATHFGGLSRPTALNVSTLSNDGNITLGLPPPKVWAITSADFSAMIMPSIAVVVVGFIESYAIGITLENRALDRDLAIMKHDEEEKAEQERREAAGEAVPPPRCGPKCRAMWADTPDMGLNLLSPNSELLAFGAMNLVGAFFGAFPTFGAMSRSPVVFAAGGRSPIAGLWTAFVIVLVLLVIAKTFEELPKAVVSAIIAVAIGSLFEVRELAALWRFDKADLAMAIFTFGMTFGLGIQRGVFIALGVSVLIVLANSASLRADFLERARGVAPPQYVSLGTNRARKERAAAVDKKKKKQQQQQQQQQQEGGAEQSEQKDGVTDKGKPLTDDEYDAVDQQVMVIRVLEPVMYFSNASGVEGTVRRKVREFRERQAAAKAKADAEGDAPPKGEDGGEEDKEAGKDRSCCDLDALDVNSNKRGPELAGIIVDLQVG